METSKREKIILGLAILAVLYMGIVFLFSGSGDNSVKSETDEDSAEEFVMEVAQDVARYNLTETERTILEKAQIPWPQQPFITQTVQSTTEQSSAGGIIQAAESREFSFTGFIEIGNKRLAIINGEEYETGDRLAQTGITVYGISPEQVLLMDAEGRMRKVPRVDMIRENEASTLQHFE